MFHILSKLLSFLLLPSGILLFIWSATLLIKNRTKSRITGCFALFITYILMCPAAASFFARLVEYPEKELKKGEPYEVGVVLTGNLINAEVAFPENLHLLGSSDRLWQALRLYKDGYIRNILISGGDTGILNKSSLLEIDIAQKFLLYNGVKPEHIIIERQSQNTHENALFCSKILESEFPDKDILLITSAFHMRRAYMCFKKENTEVIPYPTNFMGKKTIDITEFIPSSNAIATNELLWKELTGIVIYRLKGFL
jgi:uncharacterized SAM-binding protein YcdF (DUF218 family)